MRDRCLRCRGQGFFAWPCRCGQQKPLTPEAAAIYGAEAGDLLTIAQRQAFLDREWPGRRFVAEERNPKGWDFTG